MNLVWHIVRKDAQLIRGPWLAWMAVQVLGLVLAGWSEYRSLSLSGSLIPYLFLMVVTWVAAYLFSATSLHDDATTGAAAGWITRPVWPRQLLAAKAIGLVLFFWVTPAVLYLPWWLVHGYGVAETGLALLETVAIFAVITTPAFWLATLTADAVQFYRWSLALLGVAGVVAVSFSWIIADPALARHPVLPLATAFVGLLLVTFAVSAVHQVLTGRRRRSLLIAAAGLGLLVAALPAITRMPVSGPHARTFTGKVSIAVLEEASSGLRLMALPSDGLPDTLITLSEASLINRDGTSRPLPLPVESAQRWTHIQGLAAGMAGAPAPSLGGIALDAEPSAQMRRHGSQATLQVRGTAWRIEGAVALPLREGSKRQGAYFVRIGQIPVITEGPLYERMVELATRKAIRMEIRITEAQPHLRADFRAMESTTEIYLLASPSGIEPIELQQQSTHKVATVAIRSARLLLPDSSGYLDTQQEWLDATHLVKLVLVPAGTFERILSVPVPTASPAPSTPIP